ncbi:methyl-accepting chemotaxis protein, partial [uncultured Aquincola sp.]|uniref:methyl-accepting chemotaxis protein n=1 Tax=uncultured Aquincola sp. TaxID=886556 RepID=UPI0032B26FF2
MSRFRIGTRLITGFLVVAGISGVVGGVALHNAARMNDLAETMYSHELMGLSHIKEANIQLIAIGRARSNFLLATTQEERQRHQAAIAKYSAEAKERLDLARPLFVTDRAKELFAGAYKTWDAYQADMKHAMDLAARTRLAERSDELVASLANVREKADALDSVLSELTDQKEKRAQAAIDEVEALYDSSRNAMLAVVGAGVLLGVLLGVLISRSVTRPLSRAVEAAGQIAKGDLSVRLETSGHDETAQLLQAMQRMMQATGSSIADVVRVTRAMAEGDLHQRIEKDYEGVYVELKTYVNQSCEQLGRVVADVNSVAEALASASEEVSATAQSLSQASSEQAA